MDIRLDPWQEEFLATEGDKHLCSGRQIGKSVVCAIDAASYAMANKGKTILMIAPTERQSYLLFDKTLGELLAKNSRLIKRGKHRPTKSRINLHNGTTIYCLPTGLSGLGIRGLTVDRLYVDEAAQVPEDVWVAVEPMMMTTGGDTIMISTPFGTQGKFYDIMINKNNAYPSFTRFRQNSLDVVKNREVSDTWTQIQKEKAIAHIESKRLSMSALAFAQEYMGQPLDDLKQVFPDKLLREVCVLERPETIRPGRDYFLGQDIAGMGGDLSTWEVLDGTNRKSVRHVQNITKRRIRTPERVRVTVNLERHYRFKRIGIDDGGLGSGDFDYLLRDVSTKRKVRALNNASRDLDKDGEKKRRLLKEDMYNNMLAMLEHGHLKLLKDDDVYASLKSVQFEITNGKTRYFGSNTHVAEGLIRAAWLAKSKALNIWIA